MDVCGRHLRCQNSRRSRSRQNTWTRPISGTRRRSRSESTAFHATEAKRTISKPPPCSALRSLSRIPTTKPPRQASEASSPDTTHTIRPPPQGGGPGKRKAALSTTEILTPSRRHQPIRLRYTSRRQATPKGVYLPPPVNTQRHTPTTRHRILPRIPLHHIPCQYPPCSPLSKARHLRTRPLPPTRRCNIPATPPTRTSRRKPRPSTPTTPQRQPITLVIICGRPTRDTAHSRNRRMAALGRRARRTVGSERGLTRATTRPDPQLRRPGLDVDPPVSFPLRSLAGVPVRFRYARIVQDSPSLAHPRLYYVLSFALRCRLIDDTRRRRRYAPSRFALSSVSRPYSIRSHALDDRCILALFTTSLQISARPAFALICIPLLSSTGYRVSFGFDVAVNVSNSFGPCFVSQSMYPTTFSLVVFRQGDASCLLTTCTIPR